MGKKISRKKKNKTGMAVMAAMLIIMLPVNVYAVNGSTIGLTALATFFSDVVKIIGVIMVIYGISVFGPGMAQHDNSQIRMGLLVIAGGAIMVFHMAILNTMGITI